MWVQGSAKKGRRAYLVGRSPAALTAAEDGQALWHTKMGAGVVVRAAGRGQSGEGDGDAWGVRLSLGEMEGEMVRWRRCVRWVLW